MIDREADTKPDNEIPTEMVIAEKLDALLSPFLRDQAQRDQQILGALKTIADNQLRFEAEQNKVKSIAKEALSIAIAAKDAANV